MRISRSAASVRGGFTLIEMLISVALVMLMMVMFAAMFGTAVGTMRRQRGLANNDQKARALTALLRGDLEAATYKSQLYSDSAGLVPLVAGDIVDPNQKGYFYIAENDPGSETDDNLQLTIWVAEPISGRAQLIGQPDGDGSFDIDPALPDLNQPDGDDGILNNDVTWSRAAEVSYFLRNGTLYRRVLLLRDPLPHNPVYPTQPTMGVAGEGTDSFSAYADRLLPGVYDADADQDDLNAAPADTTIGDFWADFDSSACWVYDDTSGAWLIHFNSIDSLDNNRGHENHPLGMPLHRFGHDPGMIAAGQPLEFLTTLPATPEYIGRFTHEETSSAAFGFPGPASDPFTYEDGTGHTLANGDVAEYANGPRAGEDIVMTGVEAFNLEVLDEGWSLAPADRAAALFPKFVNLGQAVYPPGGPPSGPGDPNNEFAGDFSDFWITNPAYGTVFGGNRFDTWHPAMLDNSVAPPTVIPPPFRPLRYTPVAHTPGPGSFYAVNDVVVPTTGFVDQSIVYQCVAVLGSGESAAFDAVHPDQQFEWSRVPGAEFFDGVDASNGVVWRAVDNRIGLKMIRVTIRYVDGQTGGLRQLTTYHSFVESR